MKNSLTVHIYSFSYHNSGIPDDTTEHNGGFVFDCRFLPNPGREERYKKMTGKDDEVIDYFSHHDIVFKFLACVFEIIDSAVENYISRDFTDIMVSFGCTGGQHRSVFCAEKLAEFLIKKNITVEIKHVELEKYFM